MHIQINNNVETLTSNVVDINKHIDHAIKLYQLDDIQRANIEMILDQEKEALAIFNGKTSPAICMRVERELVDKYSIVNPKVVYAAIEVQFDLNK